MTSGEGESHHDALEAFLKGFDEAKESENTTEGMNFVKAAFILQESTVNYCKKVDSLHQDCFNALDMFSVAGPKSTKTRGVRRRVNAEDSILVDDILVTLDSRITPARDIDVSETIIASAPTAPAHLPLALAPREESERKTNSMLAAAVPHPSGFFLLDAFDSTRFANHLARFLLGGSVARTASGLTTGRATHGQQAPPGSLSLVSADGKLADVFAPPALPLTDADGAPRTPQSGSRGSTSQRPLFEGEGDEGDAMLPPVLRTPHLNAEALQAQNEATLAYDLGGQANDPFGPSGGGDIADGNEAQPANAAGATDAKPKARAARKARGEREERQPWSFLDPHEASGADRPLRTLKSDAQPRKAKPDEPMASMWLGNLPPCLSAPAAALPPMTIFSAAPAHLCPLAAIGRAGLHVIGDGFDLSLHARKALIDQSLPVGERRTAASSSAALAHPTLFGYPAGQIRRRPLRCERDEDCGLQFADFETAPRRKRSIEEALEAARREKRKLEMAEQREQRRRARMAAQAAGDDVDGSKPTPGAEAAPAPGSSSNDNSGGLNDDFAGGDFDFAGLPLFDGAGDDDGDTDMPAMPYRSAMGGWDMAQGAAEGDFLFGDDLLAGLGDVEDELARILLASDRAIQDRTHRERVVRMGGGRGSMSGSQIVPAEGGDADEVDLAADSVLNATRMQSSLAAELLSMQQRVRSWSEQIEPILNADLDRAEFDERQGKQKVIDAAKEKAAQLAAAAAAEAKDAEEQQALAERATGASFSTLVSDQPRWEVCRSFLLTLMLANEGTLEICAVDGQDEASKNDEGAVLAALAAPSQPTGIKGRERKRPARKVVVESDDEAGASDSDDPEASKVVLASAVDHSAPQIRQVLGAFAVRPGPKLLK